MDILLATGYYPPEGGSGSRLAGELARFLAAAGHAVTVLAPAASYYVEGGTGYTAPTTREGPCGCAAGTGMGTGYTAPTMREGPRGCAAGTGRGIGRERVAGSIRVVRAGLPSSKRLPHKVARGYEHLVRPFALLPAGLRLPAPDLVYGFSLQPAGVAAVVALARQYGWRQAVRRRSGPGLVLHIEDLFPDNAVDTGLIPNGPVASALSAGMKSLLRAANRVLVHAPGLVPLLAGRGIEAESIPNWVDCGRFDHGPDEGRARFFPDCGKRCVALYAGILGLAQGMDDLLGLAEATRGRDDLVLAVVGDGPCREPFAAEVRRRGLSHVRLLPLVPPVEYPRLVAAGDVFLVLLPERVKYPVVPSRIGDGLAAARPLLAALPDGDARRAVEESGGGIVVPPGSPALLAGELVRLARNAVLRKQLGETGRRFALAHLDLPVVLGRLEKMLVSRR